MNQSCFFFFCLEFFWRITPFSVLSDRLNIRTDPNPQLKLYGNKSRKHNSCRKYNKNEVIASPLGFLRARGGFLVATYTQKASLGLRFPTLHLLLFHQEFSPKATPKKFFDNRAARLVAFLGHPAIYGSCPVSFAARALSSFVLKVAHL
jgi:hypothetical protein